MVLWWSLSLAAISLAAQTLTVLHGFSDSDGDSPFASVVIDPAGNLYGVTRLGGPAKQGVVFMLDPSGHETVLHTFSGSDGAFPWGGLLRDSAGNLYGTTQNGGSANLGVVFKIDSSNHYTVLHNFVDASGGNPLAGLIADAAGNLYGTAASGGSRRFGVIFKINKTTNNYTELYSFNNKDGSGPRAALIMDDAGNLYGTTERGGVSGMGVVFQLDTSNHLNVLHSFNEMDGSHPYGGLIMDNRGYLYGTTVDGGPNFQGVVFRVGVDSDLQVLYSFSRGTPSEALNGINPWAGLAMDQDGDLFGVTLYGGEELGSGYGVVFEIDRGNNYKVIHRFTLDDGFRPAAALIMDAGGNLYGTTVGGGPGRAGEVYKINCPECF